MDVCGRYTFFDDTEDQTLLDILNQVNGKHPMEPVRTGEIFPTNPAPVLMQAGGRLLEAERMLWGFPNLRNKGVIINARAETAAEKPMFRKSLEQRRCVIPSTGFYEWSQDGEKKKYRFNLPDTEALYMAGFYQQFDGGLRFVILTTAANESMREIHHRMPVVLSESETEAWVKDRAAAELFLRRVPAPLSRAAV